MRLFVCYRITWIIENLQLTGNVLSLTFLSNAFLTELMHYDNHHFISNLE